MAESTPSLGDLLQERQSGTEDPKESNRGSNDAHKVYAKIEHLPTNLEIWLWYIYGLSSYFIHTVLLPVVFPLIISQMVRDQVPEPPRGWRESLRGSPCGELEMKLYEYLTYASITSNLSALNWMSVSWAAGILIAAPILAVVAFHLDHGQNQIQISAAATVIGAVFCLPAGFFNSVWVFAPYTAAIVAASTVAAAGHTRHLGLMLRGLTGGARLSKLHFPTRCAIASWLSLYATAAGMVGSTIIVAFTYHMLRKHDRVTSLWVVSIFGGLIWLAGVCHAYAGTPTGQDPTSVTSIAHAIHIFKYPHAAGSLTGVLLSSFSSMCIFTGAILYVIGHQCIKPVLLLCLWLVYFIFPLFSLPLLHPLQVLIRADALRMQLLGFLLSAAASGAGFLFRHRNWRQQNVIIGAVVQSTGAAVLHAFGRVLLLDCAPAGREGSFSVWYVWVKALGTCAGFAVASAYPKSVAASFGAAFCAIVAGIVILIFGNISNFGGAVAAGHVRGGDSGKGSPAHGREGNGEWKGGVRTVEIRSPHV